MQVYEPTKTFYDVDAADPLEQDGVTWLPVTRVGLGFSHTWKVLYERVPDGTMDGINIDELGARMRLIRNLWYVDSRDVNRRLWRIMPERRARVTCLQIVAGITILGYSLWMLTTSGQVSGNWTLAVAGIVALTLIADYLIQRRGT